MRRALLIALSAAALLIADAGGWPTDTAPPGSIRGAQAATLRLPHRWAPEWLPPGVPRSAVIGAWDWRESTNLTSVSGNGLTLSWVDTTSPSSNRNGSFVELRNRLAAVALPTSMPMYPATIVACVRAPSAAFGGMVSLRQNSAVSTNTRFQATVYDSTGGGMPRIRASQDGSTFSYLEATGSPTAMVARAWVLGGENTANDWRIYESGARIDSGRTGTVAAGSSAYHWLSIGGIYNGGAVTTNWWTSDVAYVAVYSAALTPAQIAWQAPRICP